MSFFASVLIDFFVFFYFYFFVAFQYYSYAVKFLVRFYLRYVFLAVKSRFELRVSLSF